MLRDKITKSEKAFLELYTKYRFLYMPFILISLVLIYLLVIWTGGLKYSYSHTMYIPIVLAGLIYGKTVGAITAIVAGLLLGPLLPLDVTTGESQVFINWFYRLIIFTAVGYLSGAFATLLRKDINKIVTLYSSNPDTAIPNRNYLETIELKKDDKEYLLASIIIHNHSLVVEMLGSDYYIKILREIYKRLKENLVNHLFIIQVGSNKLWIASRLIDIDTDIKEVYDVLKHSITIDGIPIYIEFSLGSAVVLGKDKCKKNSSFRQPDAAAHYAHKNGKPYEIFKAEYIVKQDDYELLGAFTNALETDQTFLVFQPKVNLNNGKTYGFEALIRWQHPTKGLLTPDKFIPLVEQTKLIHSLTDWVLKKVIQKIIEFRDNGIKINISLNISVKNLANSSFYENVIHQLHKYDISPNQLELEITESVLMDNIDENLKQLHSFNRKGVLTTIDDYGTGYSSLQYLARLPIKIVKIDKYFISEMSSQDAIKGVVESSVNLSHRLGYKVLAEGIENIESLEIAKELKCDYGQGYYFSRPLDDEIVLDWFKKNG